MIVPVILSGTIIFLNVTTLNKLVVHCHLLITLISMTTDKLKVNAFQEESIVPVNKRVWVKPIIEVISIQTGILTNFKEGLVGNTQKSLYAVS